MHLRRALKLNYLILCLPNVLNGKNNRKVSITNKHLMSSNNTSFYLLKPETYLFAKKQSIKQRVQAEGFSFIAHYQIKLSFADLMALYPNVMARLTMSLRLPFIMSLDMYLVQKHNAVQELNKLKYEIREHMLGTRFGGFLHTPDSKDELNHHLAILKQTNWQRV